MATVLVVDDEPDIRELVRLNLELDGHRVITAVDGPDGLAALRRENPDVVVLDVMMPGLDGWEVLGQIKAGSDSHSATPVVMLTALASEMDQARGGIEGAVHYITKPFSIEDLRAQVRAALDGSEPEMRRQAQTAALGRLAQLESGRPADGAPRPRLTRFENARDEPVVVPPPPSGPIDASGLSDKQKEMIEMVASTPTVREAADRLSVSRSNVYASLRRIARKLDVSAVPELVKLARAGEIDTGSASS